MDNLQDYSIDVHKSLHQPDLLLGIPKVIVALIFIVTTFFVYLFGFWCIFLGVLLYIPCRFLSKDDPDMLEIALDSLFQLDHLEG